MVLHHKTASWAVSVIGWYGVAAILGAYTLRSLSVIPANGLLYQLLNLTGAMGIILVSVREKNHQPAVLNGVWALVALVSIIRLLL